MVTRPLQLTDLSHLRRILDHTENFNGEEVDVAMELLHECVDDPETTYRTLVVMDDAVRGYICFGRTPMTDHTFDLYWIVVEAGQQGRGIGRKLYAAMEEAVRKDGGKVILIETSSSEGYDATQAFYGRLGFDELSRVRDFYRAGDDLITYIRYL